MIGLSKNWNGTPNGDTDATPDAIQPASDVLAPVPSTPSRLYPPTTRLVEGDVFRHSPVVPQKKRIRRHADYRKLLALEAEARKMNLCRPPASARSSLDKDPRAYERALCSGEDNGAVEMPMLLPHCEAAALSEAHRPVILAVDQRMNMHFGSGRDLKSVVAVKTAALIAWRMLSLRRPMATIVFNDKRTIQIGVGCNRLHTLLTLQALVNQNHDLLPEAGICSNPRMLNDALRSVKKLALDPMIFLVTDTSGRDEETLKLTTSISENSNLVVVLIYDPSQIKFSNFTRHRRFENYFFPEGVPVVPINTRGDLMRQLQRSLTSSALRARAARSRPVDNSSTAQMR